MDFQLLFILIVVAAAIFDAAGRARRRRMPQPEEESEEVPVSPGEARTGAAQRRWEAAERGGALEAPEPGTGTATREGRETADSMVPADLWAVLTGEASPGTRTRDPAGRAGTERSDDSRDVEPWDEMGIEGESVETIPPAPREREWKGDPTSIPWRPEPPPTPPAPAAPAAKAAPAVPPVPLPLAAARARRAPGRGPGKRASGAYSALLSGAGPGGLRRAIVLTEILGKPVALRRSTDPWEGG